MDFITTCFLIGIPLMIIIGIAAYVTINKKDKVKEYDMNVDPEVQKKIDEINKAKIIK